MGQAHHQGDLNDLRYIQFLKSEDSGPRISFLDYFHFRQDLGKHHLVARVTEGLHIVVKRDIFLKVFTSLRIAKLNSTYGSPYCFFVPFIVNHISIIQKAYKFFIKKL